MPKYWKYDLTEDIYGTLPKKLLLDSHSQIAPGLVTVYDETLDITKDTTALDSFRLYEYNYGNPKDLWLNYKRVGGIYVDGEPSPIRGGLLAADNDLGDVQTFTMDFTDIKNDDDNTEREIKALTGKIPVLPSPFELVEMSAVPQYIYIQSSALNSFSINKDLTDIISFTEVYENTSSDTEETDSNSDTTSDNTETTEIILSAETISTDKMAVMPMRIRLKVPRKSQILSNVWNELDAAEDARALFRTFNKYGTVLVRSSAAGELDADLFRAISNKGGNLGVSAEDCVSAFLYEDNLCLDFMVFAADAVSKNTGKTAFVEIFKDDDVPYVIIGDGELDKKINLTFYVDTPLEPAASASVQNNSSASVAHSSGGGTCNINHSWIFIFVFIMFALIKVNRALKTQKIRR